MSYRLTGAGAFGIQAEWEKVDGDTEVASRVVTFLEDRRLLFGARHAEDEMHCVRSALEIRSYLTSELSVPRIGKSLATSLRAMRGACRKFVEAAGPDGEYFRRREEIQTDPFSLALGELRILFGLHVTILAANYNLDIEEELASIMHPAIDDDGGEIDFIPGFY